MNFEARDKIVYVFRSSADNYNLVSNLHLHNFLYPFYFEGLSSTIRKIKIKYGFYYFNRFQ